MFCSMKGIIMISYIKGEILYNNGDSLVVENNGIGYEIIVPAFSAQKLCAQKGIVTVFTYMSVREDGITLFGFASREEKNIYEKLISVSGIGPKAAVSILSVLTTSQLITAIVSGDAAALSRAPGIGKKTAQRVILELKDKIVNEDITEAFAMDNDIVLTDGITINDDRSEAVEALTSLGYTRSEAVKCWFECVRASKTDPKYEQTNKDKFMENNPNWTDEMYDVKMDVVSDDYLMLFDYAYGISSALGDRKQFDGNQCLVDALYSDASNVNEEGVQSTWTQVREKYSATVDSEIKELNQKIASLKS